MSSKVRLTFLENAAAGTSGERQVHAGGKFGFMAEATWGGGNQKLQIQNPKGTWADVASSTLSANGMAVLYLPAGNYRVVATTSTANYTWLVPIADT